MAKYTVGIFGFAHNHITAIQRIASLHPDDFEIIGYADTPVLVAGTLEEKMHKKLEEKHGAEKYYEDWKELAAKKPFLALVTCDNVATLEVCRELMEKGINVILEKPMTMHYDDAVEIARIAKANNVFVFTNWPIAWFPAFQKAREIAHSGRIGKIMRVVYRSPATWGPYSYPADKPLPPEEELKKTWWYRKDRGGGSILDYACYGAMLSTWIYGKQAERVACIAKQFSTKFCDVEDYSAMLIDFGDAVGLLEGSWSSYNPAEIPSGPIIYGTDGVVVCDRHSTTVKIYEGRAHAAVPPTEVIECADANAGEALYQSLMEYLNGGEINDMLNLENNLAVVATLEAGRISAETGVTAETKKYEI